MDSFIRRGIWKFSRFLNVIAGVFLVGMTALTCADVVLRAFRHPILGTYEIIGFLGALTAGFALAYTTLIRGHVAVEILVMHLSKGLQKIIYLLVNFLSFGIFFLLGIECVRYGNDLKMAGEVSLTLELPIYPILYGLAFASIVVCLVIGIDFLSVLLGRCEPWYRWRE